MNFSTNPCDTGRRWAGRPLGAVQNRLAPAVSAFLTSPATVTRMALVIAALPVLERVLSLPRLVRLLASPTAVGREQRQSTDSVESAVAARRRFLEPLLGLRIGRFRQNCMTQSLVLFHCLRRAAIPVSVHFGIARAGEDALNGHCWLQHGDLPIGEDPEPLGRLRLMYQYPST